MVMIGMVLPIAYIDLTRDVFAGKALLCWTGATFRIWSRPCQGPTNKEIFVSDRATRSASWGFHVNVKHSKHSTKLLFGPEWQRRLGASRNSSEFGQAKHLSNLDTYYCRADIRPISRASSMCI